MTVPYARRLAWSLGATSVAMLLVGWALTVAAEGSAPVVDSVLTVALTTFPVVGALVASRRPQNAIGWLFCAAGVLFGAGSLADGYASVAAESGSPGAVWAAWLSTWLFLPPVFGTPPLLFLLFPDGRPLSRRWRWAVWLAAVAIVLQTTGIAFAKGELVDASVAGIENPVGVPGADLPEGLGWGLGILSILLATVSLVLRFRWARGKERLQLAWFVSAAGLFALACVTGVVVWSLQGELPAAGKLVILTVYATIPVAAGVAILRHRLYDIEVVVNRTLVYGALTAALVGAYLGSVLVFRFVLSPLTGTSDLAVAGSTLAVAALFRPLRSRIQSVVDRRFYRARYDAARTLEEFSQHLRDELDLEALGTDLRRVVGETMAPSHVSLWVRSAP